MTVKVGKGSHPFENYPLGIVTATTWLDVANLVTIIRTLAIRAVIEIGVYRGGIATMLMSRIPFDGGFRYLGVEILDGTVDASVLAQAERIGGANIVIDDCFSGAFKAMASNFINDTIGRAMVFCDGVDKPKEMNHFAGLIRRGDYLLAHDYVPEGGSPGNPGWADIEPFIAGGSFVDARPEHWSDQSLFLLEKK